MRAIMAEPDSPPQTSAQSGEESMLVSSLRDALAKQAVEIDGLKRLLAEAATSQQTVCSICMITCISRLSPRTVLYIAGRACCCTTKALYTRS